MKIAIITASSRPIPATSGGATQTMMTHLINVNEEKCQHTFSIFSYYERKAEEESKKYRHTNFYYYKPNAKWDYVYSLFFRFLRKVTNEQIYVRCLFVKYCANIISNNNFDAVVLEGNCFWIQQLRTLIKNKIILHMHIDRLNKELKSANKMIDAADGLFAISEFCKHRMAEVDSSCSKKVFVVKNTIDTKTFTFRGNGIKQMIRSKFGVKPKQKVISYCGRIDQTKGVLELVYAVKLLDDANLHLTIIGSSVYQGGKISKYVEKVEHEARTLRGGVSFTGYISQEELPNYISASDVAIVPSLCLEAAGNVTIEALSCGVPVIASSQGGIPEYADQRACRLIKADDDFVENLAKQIQTIVYDDELYSSLKNNTRDVALQYDKYNYYINFCNAVEKVLDL